MSAMAPPARVLVVAGPTAVGKSSAALRLCEARDGELVSADSVQLYRGLDVGSNKPSPALPAEYKSCVGDLGWDANRTCKSMLPTYSLRARAPETLSTAQPWPKSHVTMQGYTRAGRKI